jgi:hypothetical protein
MSRDVKHMGKMRNAHKTLENLEDLGTDVRIILKLSQ